MRYFTEIFGKAIPCKKIKKPEPYVAPEKDENEEKVKEESAETGKKKKNKKNK